MATIATDSLAATRGGSLVRVAAFEFAHSMTVRADYLAFFYFFHKQFHCGIGCHLSDIAIFVAARKVIEMQRGGVGVIPTITTTPLQFDFIDKGNTFSEFSFPAAIFGTSSINRTRAVYASAIALLAQTLASLVPVVTVFTNGAKVIMRSVELGYTCHVTRSFQRLTTPPDDSTRRGGNSFTVEFHYTTGEGR